MPIFYNIESEDVLEESNGRIVNSNAGFGFVGMYLLLQNSRNKFNTTSFQRICLFISVIGLIIGFNRTFLAVLGLGYIYLSFKNFDVRSGIKLVTYPLIFLGFLLITYTQFETIRKQVDRRIISIISNDVSIYDATIENNRDFIYEGIIEKIKSNDWVIGLPINIPIFTRPPLFGRPAVDMTLTDISVVNMILRYGIAVTIMIFIIYRKMYRLDQGNMYKFYFVVLLISSWNINSILGLNTAFFLILIFIFTNPQLYGRKKERFIYS